METIRKNITLVLGLSIPVMMILLVAGSIYIPGLFIKPHFNFLYAVGDDSFYWDDHYSYNQHWYSVQNGKLTKNEIKHPEDKTHNPPQSEAKLYYCDVTKNESREISFEEAQKYNLDTSEKSPDGFEVVNGNRDGGFFPFFGGVGGDYGSKYLKGHNVSRKLNLQMNSDPYRFRLLGWIKD